MGSWWRLFGCASFTKYNVKADNSSGVVHPVLFPHSWEGKLRPTCPRTHGLFLTKGLRQPRSPDYHVLLSLPRHRLLLKIHSSQCWNPSYFSIHTHGPLRISSGTDITAQPSGALTHTPLTVFCVHNSWLLISSSVALTSFVYLLLSAWGHTKLSLLGAQGPVIPS